ncbi:uncharacterized protein LOC144101740 [Amblyomma americanum]
MLHKLQSYAAGFQLHGVEPGDRVCCHFSNGIESFAALFAAISAGAVAVLADDELTKGEVLAYAESTKVQYVLTDIKNANKFFDIKHKLKKCFLLGGELPGFQSVSEFGSIASNVFRDRHYAERPEERPAAISFSSGTTGNPKAIMTTHYTFVSSITTIRSCHLMEPGDRYVILESMAHAFGFFFTMYAACIGATAVITSTTPEFNELVAAITKHKVEVICCFPTALSRLSRCMESTGYQLPSVRRILCTGGGIPPTVGKSLLRQFKLTDLKNFLGCSEALAAYCIPPPGETSSENVGFPSANVKMKVISPDKGTALGTMAIGEIWVHTRNVTPGYLCPSGQLQPVADDQGWLHTGDLGYFDETGRFFVVDRLKNIIKCHDYNVAPRELEAILLTHPAVVDVCVIGVPDATVSEAPTAFVVRKRCPEGEARVTEAELVDLVAGENDVPSHHISLPYTLNGR